MLAWLLIEIFVAKDAKSTRKTLKKTFMVFFVFLR
jgi:hypothetical protein